MYRAKMYRYGGAGSSQGADGASGLLRQLSIRGSQGERITPLSLAHQSQYQHIAKSMKCMMAKHNNAVFQRFQLPLKSEFIAAMQSAGIPDPFITVQDHGGSFQATIEMEIGTSLHFMQGEVCYTEEAAETSVVAQALEKLKRLQHVVLVDISARKHKAAIRTGRKFYMRGCSSLTTVDSMMGQWCTSLDDLSSVEDFALEKLKAGNGVQKQFSDAVHISLLVVKGASIMHMSELDAKIRGLRAERDKYVAASRLEPLSIPQIPKRKAYYHDMDALALLLKWLRLEECKYSSEIDENDLYLGCAELTFPDNRTAMICADAHKNSLEKAYNAAARKAILYLEDLFKVDVAGYDHHAAVVADQETFVWKGLLDEILSLGDNVLVLWEDMLKKVEDTIEQHKKTRIELAQHASVGSEMVFIHKLIEHLDSISAKCKQTYSAASSKLASLKSDAEL